MAGIEPAWLEEGQLEEQATATCPVCKLVLEQPTSGCPEGHAACNKCYVEELSHRQRCPTCRHPTDESKCGPSREPQRLSAVTMPPSVP